MPSDGMIKLRNEGIIGRVIRVDSGFFTMKEAAQVTGATERRVQKLVKKYHEMGGDSGIAST